MDNIKIALFVRVTHMLPDHRTVFKIYTKKRRRKLLANISHRVCGINQNYTLNVQNHPTYAFSTPAEVVDKAESLGQIDFLIDSKLDKARRLFDLSDRIFKIPVMHGVDGADYDFLHQLAATLLGDK